LVISLLTGLLVGWLNWKAGTWLGVLLISILFFLPYVAILIPTHFRNLLE
jgi:ABC-type Fe3+ transport system permease subunit